METTERTNERSYSTPEMFAQHWPHLRQRVKAWWDRLSDADLEQVAGDKDRLIRMIQARYGYASERAEQEVDQRLGEVAGSLGSSGVGRLAESVGQVGTTAAATVADTVARARSFLPELPGGFVGLIRRYPVPSLLVGMGLGFVLGSSLARSRWVSGEQASRRQSEAGYPEALIQCTRCGQMVRQADIVSHSTTCGGAGSHSHGGSPA